MSEKKVIFDFETRSMCDLKKHGAYNYSMHPTTQPTCMAFKLPQRNFPYLLKFDAINRVWSDHTPAFRDMWTRLINEKYLFTAHNAYFETCIYQNILVDRYGWPAIPFNLFRCTAAKAAACALPRNLEGAGAAMALTTQKDKRGYAAMMATCKPTRQYTAWRKAVMEKSLGIKIGAKKQALAKMPAPPVFLEPEVAPEVWNTLYEYCKIDVLTEELLDKSLPDLIPFEQELWFLNQKVNTRGIRVDIPTIEKVINIMWGESRRQLSELDSLTMGLVTKPGARQAILDFLALDGIVLKDIKAGTVSDALKVLDSNSDMARLLELRQALSKTSTKKYEAFLARAGVDGRVRDILLYHGASTGRDTGTGIQPQNFPRGLIAVDPKRPYAAVENVIECDAELLKILYGDNLSILFSALLRNMLMASEGFELFVADFAKIEVAVLWWLSDNLPGLEILAAKKDPYKYMAMANTGQAYDDITEEERQLGKAQTLGCGFGLGVNRFRQTAWDNYRLKLSLKQSQDAVKAYRTANAAVPKLWIDYEDAAVYAVETEEPVTVGKCEFHASRGFLWVKLPSGRRLAYRKPFIEWKTHQYEHTEMNAKGVEVTTIKTSAPKKTLHFYAVNSMTKKWDVERTFGGKLTENIVQAVARDLMMTAALRLEKADYKLLLTVHDEAICERKAGEGSVKEFRALMCVPPVWADEKLHLDAKAYTALRYRKG